MCHWVSEQLVDPSYDWHCCPTMIGVAGRRGKAASRDGRAAVSRAALSGTATKSTGRAGEVSHLHVVLQCLSAHMLTWHWKTAASQMVHHNGSGHVHSQLVFCMFAAVNAFYNGTASPLYGGWQVVLMLLCWCLGERRRSKNGRRIKPRYLASMALVLSYLSNLVECDTSCCNVCEIHLSLHMLSSNAFYCCLGAETHVGGCQQTANWLQQNSTAGKCLGPVHSDIHVDDN